MQRTVGISRVLFQRRSLILCAGIGSNAKEQAGGSWDPPRPNPWAEYPYQDQLKIFLDDVVHELAVLIEQRPPSEKKGHQIDSVGTPASDDLLDALEALACEYPISKTPSFNSHRSLIVRSQVTTVT